MRKATLLFTCILFVLFTTACRVRAPQEQVPGSPGQEPWATNPAAATPDAVASPSVAADEEALIRAMGANGTWIILFTQDITSERELVLEGEYTNGRKDNEGRDIIQRKIALYTQDANRNITNRFTLTAPQLTINSPMASLVHGTFKGDLLVSAQNFQLIGTTVEGNVYFTTEQAQETFAMDENSSITGETGMHQD